MSDIIGRFFECSANIVRFGLSAEIWFRGRNEPCSVKYDFISNDHGTEILHGWSFSLWPVLSGFLILNGFTTVQKDAENSNCMMLIQMLRISKKNNSNDESTRSR